MPAAENGRTEVTMSRKVVAITGASRGIGKAIALKYAKEGYDTAICCHSREDALQAAKQEIEKLSVNCITFVGDIGIYKNAAAFLI